MKLALLLIHTLLFIPFSPLQANPAQAVKTFAEETGETTRIALLPYPSSIQWGKRLIAFEQLDDTVKGQLPSEHANYLKREIDHIRASLSISKSQQNSSAHPALSLRLQAGGNIPGEPGTYTLRVSLKEGVIIQARDFNGLFNGLQTLRQLINKNAGGFNIPECQIHDIPAFQIRGFMLDVGRYYMTPDFIKELVRNLSKYKINTLHLHLTDNPGWRIQTEQYPQLTADSSFWPSRLPGKFYTKQDIGDIVEYCSSLNVRVIPEIDMPGHSEPFQKAMGFPMQSEQGLAALKKILDEIVPLFPDPLFHIGPDEVNITQRSFIPEITAHLREKGKNVIVWSPGGIPDDKAVKMCWGENEAGAQLPKDTPIIDTNGFYLDWMDSQSGVYQTFFQQPCETPRGSSNALGGIMPVWCDGNLSNERRILEQYPFYPCGLTFAERIWKGRSEKRKDFMAQLPDKGTEQWQEFSDFENRLIIHRDRYFPETPFAYVRQANIKWKLIGPFDHKGKNDTSFEPEKTIKRAYNNDGKTIKWQTKPVYGGAIHFRHLYATFNMHNNRFRPEHWPTRMSPLLGNNDVTCYALAYIKSPIEQNVYLMFGLNGMWGHSGGYRTARAPEQGSWDFSGGDIWLNGQRIPPPRWPFKSLPWTGWGKGRIEDAPLTEEGYFFRPPVKITLKKGLNKILVRSVFGHWKGDDGERKWQFCCIPVNWNGIHYTEVKGLEYIDVIP